MNTNSSLLGNVFANTLQAIPGYLSLGCGVAASHGELPLFLREQDSLLGDVKESFSSSVVFFFLFSFSGIIFLSSQQGALLSPLYPSSCLWELRDHE